jgi:hypothetical protein
MEPKCFDPDGVLVVLVRGFAPKNHPNDVTLPFFGLRTGELFKRILTVRFAYDIQLDECQSSLLAKGSHDERRLIEVRIRIDLYRDDCRRDFRRTLLSPAKQSHPARPLLRRDMDEKCG